MKSKFMLSFVILLVSFTVISFHGCGKKEEEKAGKRVATTSSVQTAPASNHIIELRKDRGDGDLEIVLSSGFVLEVDKESGQVEVEDYYSNDLGEQAVVIQNSDGTYDVALADRPEIVFLRNVAFKYDTDGDYEIQLGGGIFGLILEIDKDDRMLELEDIAGNDLWKKPEGVIVKFSSKFPDWKSKVKKKTFKHYQTKNVTSSLLKKSSSKPVVYTKTVPAATRKDAGSLSKPATTQKNFGLTEKKKVVPKTGFGKSTKVKAETKKVTSSTTYRQDAKSVSKSSGTQKVFNKTEKRKVVPKTGFGNKSNPKKK